MYESIVFLGYIFATYVGLTGIALIFLVLIQTDSKKTKLYKNARIFTLNVFCIGVFYFILYYRETNFNHFQVGLILRTIDYTICTIINYFWIKLMNCFMERENKQLIFRLAGYITFASLIVSFITNSMFLDEYYFISNEKAREIIFAIEIIIVLSIIAIIIKYTIEVMKEVVITLTRRYVLIVSVSLIIFDINQLIINRGLYSGKYGISAWVMEVFDPTGLILLIISLATLIFVFKADFSPIYFSTMNENLSPLDLIAQKHRLTQREWEVMGLVYLGKTNPEIAEQLFISKNTVKSHIHNIYEKFDVTTRIELIHMINSQNHPHR